VVVGAGPNGLSAAIVLARTGKSVLVVEAKDTVGGGARSDELTLPGFVHDICSTAYPLGAGSPFFKSLPLEQHGLEWVHPTVPLAHPLDDGTAVVLSRSLDETAAGLGADAKAYRKLMGPLVEGWNDMVVDLLSPFRRPPRHPFAMMRFGLTGMRSVRSVAMKKFDGERARALFAGIGGHSMQPLERSFTAAFGLVLGTAGHAVGWPFARGGAHSITLALASYFESLGGEILTNTPVESIDDLPTSRAVLCDVTPAQMLKIAEQKLRGGYRRGLEKYRYGVGVFKIDFALDGPIPWTAPEAGKGGTVHVGGRIEDVAEAEAAIWNNKHPEKPFVLVAQPSLFDDSRAPEGKHTAWAYSHVPNGTTFDMTDRIEAQIERFAPGFRDLILAKHVRPPLALQEYNANYVGGDINGGVQDFGQLFTRPMLRWNPYSTPVKGLYMCSSSTPPGGGVHGMCGYHAGRSALRDVF
jgi:phytoene dehydrogenase-like protein